MTVALLDDIGSFVASAASLTLGTNLFLSLLKDQPDEATAIYEFAGESPAYGMGQDLPALYKPRIQVITRSLSYPTARSRMETIWQALQGLRDESISGTYYLAVNALGQPEQIGRDSLQRERMMANFQVWKQ